MSLIVYIACFKKSRKYLILRYLQHFDQFHYTPVTSGTTIKLQQQQQQATTAATARSISPIKG